MTLGAVGMTFAHGVSGLWFAPAFLLAAAVAWLVSRASSVAEAEK